MVKQTLILLSFLLCACLSNGQEETAQTVQKAKYLDGNFNKQLSMDIRYPVSAASNSIGGEIAFEITITKEGKIGSINLVEAADKSLTTEAQRVMGKTKGSWEPAKKDGEAIDQTYLVIFHFMMMDDDPIEQTCKQADQLIKKEKYDKALKLCDNTLKKWQYSTKLYQLRARINSNLNNKEEANNDLAKSLSIEGEMLTSVILVKAYGVTTTRRVN